MTPDQIAPDSWLVRRVNSAIIISGGDNKHNINPVSGLYGAALTPFGTLYAVYEFLERQLGVRWYQPGKLGTVAPKTSNISAGDINWTGKPSYSARFTWGALIKDDKDISAQDCIAWNRRMRRGCAGGSPIGMHSFNKWPERFAASHPEYFAIQRRTGTDF